MKFTLDHPEVAAYEGELDVADVGEPAARDVVAEGHFSKAYVCSVVDIVLGNRCTAGDGGVPHFGAYEVTVVEGDEAVVAGIGRVLGNTVEVKHGLGAGEHLAAEAGVDHEACAEVLPGEGVAPGEVAFGKNGAELDVVLLVLDGGGGDGIGLVNVDCAVVVAHQVDGGVDVAHRATLLEQEAGRAQTAHVEDVHREAFAGYGVDGVVGQLGDLVAVEGVGDAGIPGEVAPGVGVVQGEFHTPVADRSGRTSRSTGWRADRD